MAFLIGTDEAGYGPFLGPLVVAASVWEVPDALRDANLYEYLGPEIQSQPVRVIQRRGSANRSALEASRADRASNSAVAVCVRPDALVLADSKVVYQPAVGLAGLERGVFAALAALGSRCASWRALLGQLARVKAAGLSGMPWFAQYDGPVPVAASVDELQSASELFATALARADIRLVALRCRLVFPHVFNDGVARLGNKSNLLSKTTVNLVKRLLRALPPGEVSVLSDKHGGRNHYAAVLQSEFPDNLVTVRSESRLQSSYQFDDRAGHHIHWSFCQGAEVHLPAALASMAAKYLREQGMAAFNAFWQSHLPQIKPTAGYPADAHRFKQDIAAKQRELKIDDHLLWRAC